MGLGGVELGGVGWGGVWWGGVGWDQVAGCVEYCRQLLAWVAPECGMVVCVWHGWPQSVVMSSISGLDGPKVQYCCQ